MAEVLSTTPDIEQANQMDEDVYVFRTSFAQQRLWFLDQFEPNSPFYNIPSAIRFQGRLQLDVFEECINEIIRRHESLRTTFESIDGKPMQVVHPYQPLNVPVVNISEKQGEEKEQETMRLARLEARKPFNLRTGPLFRVTVLKLAEDDFVVLITMHHIISDGWSMGVFIREIAMLYDAFSKGNPSPLPDLSIQYGDFAEWQQEYIAGEVLEKQLNYWKKQLGGRLPVLELPADKPRPAVQTSRGANESIVIPKEYTEGIKKLSRREGVTTYMTLMAAFQTLLYRYTGLEDICVGSPIANRNRAEIESLIGFFVNTIVLRTDLSGNPTFCEILQRVKKVTLDSYDNQDVPFERLVEVLQPERDMAHSPLFQVMFILQNTPVRVDVELPDVHLSSLSVDSGTSTFDLTLNVIEQAKGFHVSAEYNTDIFEASTIKRLLQNYQTLLASIVADSDQHIASISILSEQEAYLLKKEWNKYEAEYPLHKGIHQLFEEQVGRTPEAKAVAFDGQYMTYQELNHKANKLAHYLKKFAVGPDVTVGICAEKSLELIVAIMATLKAGGAYVPIDPSYPRDRIAYMLEDSQVSVILTQQRFQDLVTDEKSVICLDADWTKIEKEKSENLPVEIKPDNLAYMIYTSGSTGKAKGTMISHKSLVNAYCAWEDDYGLRTDVKSHLQMASFSFDVFTGDFVRALCSGGKLVLCPRELLLDAEKLYELMRREQVDCAEFVPAVLRNLVEYLDRTGQKLDFMKNLIAGSDIWYVKEYKTFLKFCGPDTRLINSFGLTEATIDSTFFEGDVSGYPEERLVPIGRSFANTRIYIVDRNFQLTPIGVPGELCVAGVNLARGYFKRPDLTAEKFVPNSFDRIPGACLYRTGDLARFLSDGNIEFLGRIDHQVKIRGYRIELGEIESTLAKYPDIDNVVVIAREDRPGDKRLVAYVVPRNEHDPDPAEMRNFLKDQMPDYMLPAAFFSMDEFPLTPNGKVDRRALPAPEQANFESAEVYVAPRNRTEQLLAEIWAKVLGLEKVGVEDNFFQIGGHSLLATQLISRIREAFNIEIPLRSIFESPTIAEFAKAVDQATLSAQGLEAPPIVPVPREGELPLSFAQERLWFLDQLEPDSPFYNIPESIRIKGDLNIELLEKSLNEIIRRHENLRTVFKTENGLPKIEILPSLKIRIRQIDLRDLGEEEKEEQVRQLATLEAQRPFRISVAPLFRATLLLLDEQEYVILYTMHHIISDQWSSNVLIRELSILYSAYAENMPSPLPELPIQYVDFAYWQRNWLQGDVLDEQINYWKQQLEDLPPLLELPTDRPRPPVQTFNGSYQKFEFPASLSRAIKDLSASESTTLFMTLMAAFQTLLYRYSGQDDICVGSPIANRNRGEIEPLIGFFINTLVFRTKIDDGLPTFKQILSRVRETSLGAYAHQDLPFEKLVEAIQPERNLSHSPLFQVMFALQNATLKAQNVSGLTFAPVEAHSGTAKFDLTLFMLEDGEKLSGALEYNTDLFDASTISRMLDHFRHLLESIVANPDQPVHALELLSESEKEQLLRDWNRTEKSIHPYLLQQWFEKQVEQTPNAVAVVSEEGPITFAGLNSKANKLAHYLQKRGVGPDVLVGISIERSIDMMVGLLGILKAGGAYVPLDLNYPMERLRYMIEDSNIRLIVTQQKLRTKLPDSDAQCILIDEEWDAIDEESADNPVAATNSENLAYVIYTSGSTGRPKGVLVTHGGLSNYLNWCLDAYPIAQGNGALVHSTIAFDATVTGLYPALLAGKPVHLVRESSDLEVLANALKAPDNYSLVKITPAHLELLSHQLQAEVAKDRARAFIIGGENLTFDQIKFWLENASDTKLINEYGPTETVVGCAVYTVPDHWNVPGSVPIGRPISNTRIYLLDKYYNPVPIGVPGEMYIGGAGVARGYLNRADLTAERFIPDPFSEELGARLYRTGDLAKYLPDGNMVFLGRTDDQVKIRGFRIELGEIEFALSKNDSIKDVVVVSKNEDRHGSFNLIAYIVPQKGLSPSTSELRSFLKARLPDYMIPTILVMIDEIPLTPNGKVDRKALPKPNHSRPLLKSEFYAPRTDTEKALTQIWEEVLNVKQIGIFDNFFELGGDSILTIQVVSKAKQKDLNLSPKHIFQYPTIEELASIAETTPNIIAEQGKLSGEVELTPIQKWFFEKNFNFYNHWNQSIMFNIRKSISPNILVKIVKYIQEHHDSLRLRFKRAANTWTQFYQQHEIFVPFFYIDLSELPERVLEKEINKLANDIQSSLDISDGPIFRFAYFSLPGDSYNRLLLVIHHLVIDGVSWRILIEDIQSIYSNLKNNEEITLPQKTTSYKVWAKRLSEYSISDTAHQETEYWKKLSRETFASLPEDFQNGQNIEKSFDTVNVTLNSDETKLLLQQVPKAFNTKIDDVILTSLYITVAEWANISNILIDLEGHGRENLFDDVDLSRTVGWFTTIYPIKLNGNGNLINTLKAIKETIRSIPNHGLGFGLLRYCLEEGRRNELSKISDAQISYNYLGRFDQFLTEESDIFVSTSYRGNERNPNEKRIHLLEITASIINGKLQIEWGFSYNCHSKKTIQSLANNFISNLKQLIALCTLPEVGGYTPSDFSLSHLDQQTIDHLFGNNKNIEDVYPLSPMQQGMLFHSIYSPNSTVYVEQLNTRLEGSIDIFAFRKSWMKVIERHPILRTSFIWKGLDEPHQIVFRDIELPFKFYDWCGQSSEDQAKNLQDLLISLRQDGFQLDKAPLMSITIIKLGENIFHFIWTYHHILLDGWSVPLLLKEIFTIYDSQIKEQEISLPKLPAYKNYIAWLNKIDISEANNFWRAYLKGFVSPTPLGLDRLSSYNNDRIRKTNKLSLTLSTNESFSLQSIARENRVTPSSIIQGIWAIILSIYSGENDVVFGTTVAGRPTSLSNSEEMIGIFINTLPVRARIIKSQSIISWLQEFHKMFAEILHFQYTPLIQIQRWSELTGNLPLFDSIIVFENYPLDSAFKQNTDTFTAPEIQSIEQTNFPLTIGVSPGERLHFDFIFDQNKISKYQIQLLIGHVETALKSLIENPECKISFFNILTQFEINHFKEWNDTKAKFSSSSCAHLWFEEQAKSASNLDAVIFEDLKITYHELNKKANQLAHYLREHGVGPEVTVGICIERSIDMIIAILGVLKAGGAYVPLDPAYPQNRLSYIIDDTRMPIIITMEHLQGTLSSGKVRMLFLDKDRDIIKAKCTDNPINMTKAENLAYVIYTSGSTGKPKGVLLQHKGLCNLAATYIKDFQIKPGYRILQFFSFSFDGSVADIFSALLSGSTLVIPGHDSLLPDYNLSDLIEKKNITMSLFPPSALSVLPKKKFKKLEKIVSGGEACSKDIVERWATDHKFYNAYGPTEGTVATSWYNVNDLSDTWNVVPIGHAISNMQIYILDEQLSQVPIGIVGEIYISGYGLARGYLNKPELTAEKFIPNPYSAEPGIRMYKTGDLGFRLQDGNIVFIGRVDNQVKVRGFRIELGEIESTITSHPHIKDAVVLVREDIPDDKRLVAYLCADCEIDDTEVNEYLKERLPDYMIPSAYIILDSFPVTHNGKIDRKALPAPDNEAELHTSYKAPQNTTELLLVRMWEQIFNRSPIGVNDNFFEVGGHSLLAIRLMNMVQEQFGKEISLVNLFQEPTIENLARLLREEDEKQRSPLVEFNRQNEKPPLFFVHPSGGSVHWYTELAKQIGKEQPFYGIQARGIDGKTALHESIESMASYYVDSIMTQKLKGPVLLGGWSYGVIVAYEMAQQLRALNQEIGLLAILDQGTTLPYDEPKDDAEMLAETFSRYFPLSAEQLRSLEPDQQFAFVLKKAKKVKAVPHWVKLNDFKKYLNILKTQQDAWRNYKPKPYPGKILLLVSDENRNETNIENALGWRDLAQGGVEIRNVPGDHISMLQLPHVRVLAKILKEYLDIKKT